MKVLIVGGTGLIGGHAALFLQSQGHAVTIASRRRPEATIPALFDMPFIRGDYLKSEITQQHLDSFEAVVFAAGSDVRHVPTGAPSADEHFLQANGEGVPRFARLARDSGVKTFVHIGSFYPHVAPDLVESVAYVRSRKLAADGVTALATGEFHACSLDAPYIVGTVPGMDVPMFKAVVQYAEGKLGIPPFAPRGGTNYMSAQSLSEAILGALENSKLVSGKSILLGDENLSFAAFFKLFFEAVGHDTEIPTLGNEHPLMPRSSLYTGERQVSIDIDPYTSQLLGDYRRIDITNAVNEIVSQYRSDDSA
ncbi:hypothetical protein ACJ41O_003199 [Fusarium nematophilum]